MYAKAILVALLSLSLSVNALPKKGNAAAKANTATCGTAVKTVTVTAAAAAATSAAASANASKGNKGSNNAASGSTGSNNAASSSSAQTSLTIDPSNIFNFSLTGQETPTAGQEASITSTNNFINFCLLFPNKQKTNGQQIVDGSCNQTPMGVIAAKALMPSSKFVSPANGATVAANTNFTVTMAIKNLETGHFTNPDSTFHMAPQQINDAGLIKGHSHVTIEQLTSLSDTTPLDPTKFVFFKGLNSAAVNGQLSVTVAGGLPAGFYRLASINSAANHQPALVAVAQRGALDDMVYFTVSASGSKTSGNNAAAASSAAASTGKTTGKTTGKKGTGRKFGGKKFGGRAAGKSRAN